MADITPERIAELRGACKDQCRDPRCDCMDSILAHEAFKAAAANCSGEMFGEAAAVKPTPICTRPADLHQPDQFSFSSDLKHHPDRDRMVVGYIVQQEVADEVASLRARLAASEKANGELRAALNELLARIDQMPNPHSDPMRHYYNQMQVWKSEAAERAGGAP